MDSNLKKNEESFSRKLPMHSNIQKDNGTFISIKLTVQNRTLQEKTKEINFTGYLWNDPIITMVRTKSNKMMAELANFL